MPTAITRSPKRATLFAVSDPGVARRARWRATLAVELEIANTASQLDRLRRPGDGVGTGSRQGGPGSAITGPLERRLRRLTAERDRLLVLERLNHDLRDEAHVEALEQLEAVSNTIASLAAQADPSPEYRMIAAALDDED